MVDAVLGILRSSWRISAVNTMGAATTFLTMIVVARVLGPADFGVVGTLQLWTYYATLARPGLMNAAVREMVPLLSRQEADEARRIQNTGLGLEVAFLVVPCSVMVIAAFAYDQPLLRVGLLFTSAAYAVTSIQGFVTEVHWAHQRFEAVSHAILFTKVAPNVVILLLLPWCGIYIVFLGPILGALAGLLTYRVKAPPVAFRVERRWDIARRLAGSTVLLTAAAMLFLALRAIDRTVVVANFPLDEVGRYTLAVSLAGFALVVVGDFGNVLQTRLWHEFGRAGDVRSSGDLLWASAVALVTASAVGGSVAQAVVPWLIPLVAPAYVGTSAVLCILMLDVAPIGMMYIPNALFKSTTINAPGKLSLLLAVAVLTNVAAVWGANHLVPGSLPAVAWGTVAAHWLGAGLLIAGSAGYWVEPRKARAGGVRLYHWIMVVLATQLAVYVVLQSGPLALEGGRDIGTLLARLGAVAVMWAGAILLAGGKDLARRLPGILKARE